MARTSKKKNPQIVLHAPAITYNAGIYARLSVDNDERKNESIETQIEIAEAYIAQQADMKIYARYTDLGRTGTNFDRTGFNQMMNDVRCGNINCIVVKDFSRFGRNYIEVGNYIEKIFPFMGVRFIAVTDHFDSLNAEDNSTQLSMNLKNIVNELYAKDIAVRVKAVKRAQQEQGNFTGGVAPYGYCVKMIGDKRSLYPDDESSKIVRMIFELYSSGMNLKAMVRYLYANRINSPIQYRKTGQIYCTDAKGLKEWSRGTVKSILTSPVYIGTLMHERTSRKERQMRQNSAVTKEDFSLVEHTHEALVDEKLFCDVAKRFELKSVYSNKDGFSKLVPHTEDIFNGILYCSECGCKMIRNSNVRQLASGDMTRWYSYRCQNSVRVDNNKCSNTFISARKLEKTVKLLIQKEFNLSELKKDDLCRASRERFQEAKSVFQQKLRRIEAEKDQISVKGSELYLKYRIGELDKKDFSEQKIRYDAELKLLETQKEDIQGKIKGIDQKSDEMEQFLGGLWKCGNSETLDAELLRSLIKRISANADKQIQIEYRFSKSEALREVVA